jgi:hypothetical protein
VPVLSLRKLACAFTLGGLTFAAALNAAAPLPAETYTKVIDADVAHLVSVIESAKANKTKKGLPGIAKATAALIALHAQENLDGKDGDKMAAVRAGAMKVVEMLGKKDLDGAEKAAVTLKSGGEKSADKKPAKIASVAKLDLHDIMHLFGRNTGGGMNLEADIRTMKKDGIKDLKLAELVGARTAAIADFTMELPPEFSGKKKKSDWDGWTKDMKTSAVEFATEAAKGTKADAAKLKKIVTALDASCTNCHNIFRDD